MPAENKGHKKCSDCYKVKSKMLTKIFGQPEGQRPLLLMLDKVMNDFTKLYRFTFRGGVIRFYAGVPTGEWTLRNAAVG